MKSTLILAGAVAATLVCAAGCSDAGPNTEAGHRHAAIIAKLKAVDQDIKSTTDVETALEKYEVTITEIQAFIEQFSETDEALELSKALTWVEKEKARLRIIQEANYPFPTQSTDLNK
ncbi:hypothetical protein OAK45_00455 [Verrucomicrobia bacterium]|nr:hypothetical protein [Verrucomicrobiota bacterium]